MTFRKLFLLTAAVMTVAALTAGCAKSKNGCVPVSVKVLYNGEPVDEAVVVFTAEDGNFSSGATGKNGVAKLSAFEPNDGAKPGKYVVTIDKSELIEERASGDPNSDPTGSHTVFHIPAVYGNRATSGLTAEVVDGQKNEFTFELDDSNTTPVEKNDAGID